MSAAVMDAEASVRNMGEERTVTIERGRVVVRDACQRRRDDALLQSAVARRGRFVLLVVAWLALFVLFVAWWFRPDHVVSAPRLVVSSVLFGWSVLLPLWFLFMLGRVRVPDPTVWPPPYRVAMVVTKAPSEPWPVVRRTLEGMLRQRPPHDTWLADEAPDAVTRSWCERHGVYISSRAGIASYHQPVWPRRTKCKEGNLAYFYDTYGYDRYHVVVQLDADHVPEPGYLEAMLRPFADPAVGYVSAPSICDANASSSWAARARLWAEATFHGPLQAGLNSGFAPLCIGSHYAVRTSALRDIGGLGPELAEDHSTAMLMNAAGWRGTHALDAIAHGDGPESFEDLAVQEFQWSRSLCNLLFTLTPRVMRGVPWPIRIQFLCSQLWYPTYALVMLASVLLPIAALLTATPWMRLSYLVFLGFSFVLASVLVTIVAWSKRRGWLRPVDAPVLSWEVGLFQILRWPWVLLGLGASILDSVRGASFGFRVTPKGGDGTRPLRLAVVVPPLLVAAVSVTAALAIDDPGSAGGYYWFTLLNAALYTVAAGAVIVLHRRENRLADQPRRGTVAATGLLAALAVLTAGACAQRGDDIVDAMTWTGDEPATSSTTPVAQPAEPVDPADVAAIDVSGATVNLGVYDPGGEFDGSDRFAIGHHFVSWVFSDGDDVRALAEAEVARGRWPMISVEPWPIDDVGGDLLAEIAAGSYDEQIDEMCGGLVDVGSPSFVRFAHEMETDTDRYPWAVDDPTGYVGAFQRFAGRCRELLGDDVFIVWSPLGNEGLEDYWPGDEYVDYVGLPVFDFPEYFAAEGFDADQDFDDNFWPKYQRVEGFDRPVMIAEFGTTRTGDDGADWINDALAATPNYPLLRTIVFFQSVDTDGVWGDEVDTPLWRIEPASLPNGN